MVLGYASFMHVMNSADFEVDQYVQAPSISDPTVSPLLAKSHEALPPTRESQSATDLEPRRSIDR